LRRAGESCNVGIASIKANSSCLSVMLRQGLQENFLLLRLLQLLDAGLENQ